MKKKLIAFISLIVVLLGCSIGYSYFTNSVSDGGNELTYDPTLSKIEVDEEDFYKYINNYYLSTEGTLNEKVESDELISDKNKRFTLSLSENILLENDIVISSDCHIDLNGKTIDLNGYQLTIRNLYNGTMIIFNGVIQDTSNKYNIIVDCPNGNVILPNVNDIDQSTFNVSDAELAYSTMKYALANIQHSSVNDFYNIVKEDIDPIETRHCVFHGDTPVDSADGCVYTYTDLQLINNYFNNQDVKISYSFSENEYISNTGDIIKLPTTTQDVTLTVTVKVGEQTNTKNIIVHIVSTSDYEKAVTASVIEHLNNYAYYEEGNFVRYHLDGAIELPMIDTYFGSTSSKIVYNLYDTNKTLLKSSSTENDYFDYLHDEATLTMGLNSSVEYISITYGAYTSPLLPIQGTSKSMIIDNYSYALGIVRESYGESLVVTKTGDSYDIQQLYLKQHENLMKYDRLVSVSYSIVNDLDYVYTIDRATAGEVVDELIIRDPKDNPPNITQTPLLNMEFVIANPTGGGNETITLQIPIELEEKDAGSGVDSFAQYYNYFDKEFKANSNNYTYHDFELPISFGSRFPIYQFKVYQITQTELDAWNIEFNKDGFIDLNESSQDDYGYNGLEENFSGKTDILNDGLFDINIYQAETTVNMSTMTDSTNVSNVKNIVMTGLGRTFIDINQYLIPQEDTYYIFFYQPCEMINDGEQVKLNIAETYDFFSLLTIPGIVRFESEQSTTNNPNEVTQTAGSEAFADINLYYEIWDLYSDEEWNYDDRNGVVSRYYGNNFILSSRLNSYIEVLRFNTYQTPVKTTYSELKKELNELEEGQTLSLNTVNVTERYTKIQNFKGIELLDGVEALYLCGVNVGTTGQLSSVITDNMMQIEYIAGMEKLKVLDISYNNLTDRPEGLDSDFKFPTGDDNEFVSKLSTLTNLEFLFLNNNYFYSFAGIESLSSLKYVNIKNNTFTVEYFAEILELLAFIDDLLTDVINSIYGSNGATNIGYFAQLQGYGTKVYEYSSGGVKDTRVQSMLGIEYQDKLKEGIDISNLYKGLSKNINDYNIPENYTIYDDSNNIMSGITLRTDVATAPNGVFFGFAPVGDDPTKAKAFALTLTYYLRYHRDGSLFGGDTITQDFEITYYVEYKVTRY